MRPDNGGDTCSMYVHPSVPTRDNHVSCAAHSGGGGGSSAFSISDSSFGSSIDSNSLQAVSQVGIEAGNYFSSLCSLNSPISSCIVLS